MIDKVKREDRVENGNTVKDDKLWYKTRLILPKDSTFIPTILRECHDGLKGGHSGVLKTEKRVHKWFHWEGLLKMVKINVTSCHTCQTHKYSTLSPARLLQPPHIPYVIWEGLSMDFV